MKKLCSTLVGLLLLVGLIAPAQAQWKVAQRTTPCADTACLGLTFSAGTPPPVAGGCPLYQSLNLATRQDGGQNVTAVQNLVCGLNADGNLVAGNTSGIVLLYVGATNSIGNSLLNLAQTGFNLSPNGTINFAPNAGWNGNGSSFLDTGYNPSTQGVALNSVATGVCVVTNRTTASAVVQFGVNDGSAHFINLGANFTGGVTYSALNEGNADHVSTATSQGSWISSRTNATTKILYNEADPYLTFSAASSAVPNGGNIFLLAQNNNGTATEFSTDQVAYFFLATGLTTAQINQIYTRLATYLAAVGETTACANTSQHVAITSPSDGATVSSTIPFTANCVPGCSQVQFFANGVQIAADTTLPYATTIDTTTLPNGNNTLTATGTSYLGSQSANITINVNNGTGVAGGAGFGVSYFITTTGNDSNNGLSPTQGSGCPPGATGTCGPWATPLNHVANINCSATGGDTIFVQPGTYSTRQFGAPPGGISNFGTTAPASCTGHGVFRTFKCAGSALDSCIINDATAVCNAQGCNLYSPLLVSSPYWIIQGFEVYSIFLGVGISGCIGLSSHDLVAVNNWAHDCDRPGFAIGDYNAIVGAVINHNAGTNADSNIDIFQPTIFDTVNTNTSRIFVAGAFVFNSKPAPCDTDGEGVIFDDWSHSQNGNVLPAYIYQGTVEQSLFVGNASAALESFSSEFNGKPAPPIWWRSTTTWANGQNPKSQGNALEEALVAADCIQSNPCGGEATMDHLLLVRNVATQTEGNSQVAGCPLLPAANAVALFSAFGFGTITNSNWVNTAVPSGAQDYAQSCCTNLQITVGAGNINSPTTALGGQDPLFQNPQIPSTSLSCAGFATTTACMAPVIANFTPRNANVASMGYQPPKACGTDNDGAFWPTWTQPALMPTGLVTTPCFPVITAGATPSYTQGATAIPLDGALTLTDKNATNLTSALVAITSGFVGGDTLNCPACNANGITQSYNSSTGALTLSGSAAVGNYQAALASVTFFTTGSTGNRIITWAVSE